VKSAVMRILFIFVKSVKTADARQNLVYNEACERWALTPPATDCLVKRHVVMAM
jgi:hypothetical protein